MTGMTTGPYENCKNFRHSGPGDSPFGGGGPHAATVTPSAHQEQSRQEKNPERTNFFMQASSLDSISHHMLKAKAVSTA